MFSGILYFTSKFKLDVSCSIFTTVSSIARSRWQPVAVVGINKCVQRCLNCDIWSMWSESATFWDILTLFLLLWWCSAQVINEHQSLLYSLHGHLKVWYILSSGWKNVPPIKFAITACQLFTGDDRAHQLDTGAVFVSAPILVSFIDPGVELCVRNMSEICINHSKNMTIAINAQNYHGDNDSYNDSKGP